MSPNAIVRFDVLTLFPGAFDGFLGESMVKRAITAGLIQVERHDLRDWGQGRHRQVDDRPFGGGPGMLIMAPPVVEAVEAVQALGERPGRLVFVTPQGRRLDQALVRELAREPRIVIVCGRYEGIDERALELLAPEEISIGDYVLSGGEVPAMAIVDAVMRLVPGALGDERSAVEDSFGPERFLDHPQYTRPREYRGRAVPEVLLGGDHAAIAQWRQGRARARTIERRPEVELPPEPQAKKSKAKSRPAPLFEPVTNAKGGNAPGVDDAEQVDGAG